MRFTAYVGLGQHGRNGGRSSRRYVEAIGASQHRLTLDLQPETMGLVDDLEASRL